MDRLARAMAWLGGLVLTGLIVMTCLSVLGRGIGLGPIEGDFEIVEAGMAFVIFAFLPICQLTAGHATVDVFTNGLPGGAQRGLRAGIDVVFAAVLIVIAVQLWAGLMSKFASGQVSFILGFPVWWGYAGAMLGALASSAVAIYVAVLRVAGVALGRDLLPEPEG
ncbi:MAG: TRAP transporter small permease [Pseudomonadota bacterium]